MRPIVRNLTPSQGTKNGSPFIARTVIISEILLDHFKVGLRSIATKNLSNFAAGIRAEQVPFNILRDTLKAIVLALSHTHKLAVYNAILTGVLESFALRCRQHILTSDFSGVSAG
jgi:hypothetical protein